MLTLKKLKQVALRKNGKCLSKVAYEPSTIYEWICKRGHRFSLSFNKVNANLWCKQCQYADAKLAEANKIAAKRGGECISENYLTSNQKLLWKCKNNHSFSALFFNIKHGGWCKICFAENNRREFFAAILKKVKQKKGSVLSGTYINNRSKLKIECKKGHVFISNSFNISRNEDLCPKCAGKAKYTLDEFKSIAKSKGGKCLSKKYVNTHSLLLWQCHKNHEWKNSASKILGGQWCPECRKIHLSEKFRQPISVLQELAKKRGGELISKRYINAHLPVKWKCGKGHTWMAKAGDVKHRTWCPKCAIIKRTEAIQKARDRKKSLKLLKKK
jgi:thiol-disulfide isomerase/thioredoxin